MDKDTKYGMLLTSMSTCIRRNKAAQWGTGKSWQRKPSTIITMWGSKVYGILTMLRSQHCGLTYFPGKASQTHIQRLASRRNRWNPSKVWFK